MKKCSSSITVAIWPTTNNSTWLTNVFLHVALQYHTLYFSKQVASCPRCLAWSITVCRWRLLTRVVSSGTATTDGTVVDIMAVVDIMVVVETIKILSSWLFPSFPVKPSALNFLSLNKTRFLLSTIFHFSLSFMHVCIHTHHYNYSTVRPVSLYIQWRLVCYTSFYTLSTVNWGETIKWNNQV